jgi:IS5 family transposase
MPRRRIGQLGWADAALAERRMVRRDRLSEVHRLVDWQPFEALLAGIHAAARGEAAYPPLMMFKLLLLQRWYDLSDPAMEEAVADRLSFRRFAGLALEDDTPDHATIWRFRERLVKDDLIGPLMAELARQMDRMGVVLKHGTLIDATIVTSAARRPRIKEAPISPVDPEARFGANNESRRFEFGYKAHIAVDAGSNLVRGVRTTPGNVQEIVEAPGLVQGDEAAVYADRGYDGDRLHRHLAERSIANGVMRRRRKGRPLEPATVARNHQLSLMRRPVEAVFGTLKRLYRMGRMRYFTMARNHLAISLACFGYNLRRIHALITP